MRLLVAPLLVVGGLWFHELIQAQTESVFIVDSALERWIPFVPWTIWIYFSFFLFIGWTVFRVEQILFWRFVSSATIAALIAWSVILVFPIGFVRPELASIASESHRQIYTFVYSVDPTHITFPSLHVAVTWICNFMLRNRPGRGQRLALSIAISLSTLFTKQHLISDVLGGIVLAWFCVWVTEKYVEPKYKN